MLGPSISNLIDNLPYIIILYPDGRCLEHFRMSQQLKVEEISRKKGRSAVT